MLVGLGRAHRNAPIRLFGLELVVVIYLESFVEANRVYDQIECWSGARWAPKFAQGWPVLHAVQPLDVEGGKILLRDFPSVLAYYESLLGLFEARRELILAWVDSVGGTAHLACWCPNTRKAKAQIAEHGSMVCHLGAVAKMLGNHGVEWKFGDKHRELIARV